MPNRMGGIAIKNRRGKTASFGFSARLPEQCRIEKSKMRRRGFTITESKGRAVNIRFFEALSTDSSQKYRTRRWISPASALDRFTRGEL